MTGSLIDRAMHYEWTADALGALLALRYSRAQIMMMVAAGLHALGPEDGARLVDAYEIDVHHDSPAEREAERQGRQWAEHCARSTYRPPVLSRQQQRQAAMIQIEGSPRARLAQAWGEASERDRRDLIARVTGGG